MHKGKVLLVKRRKEPFKNYWEVPGGKLEQGESLEKAVIREAKEETNLLIKPLAEFAVIIDHHYKFEVHLFLAEKISGQLINKEPANHAAVKFFFLNGLPHNTGKSTQRGIDKLIPLLNQGTLLTK